MPSFFIESGRLTCHVVQCVSGNDFFKKVLSGCSGEPSGHTYVVQLIVETASVAHWFALVIPSPQGRCSGFTIGTRQTGTSIVARFLLRPTGRPVKAIGAIEETTSIAEIVAAWVSTPQWRCNRATIDTFSRSIIEVISFC